jgi:hypothetical protein
MHDSENLFVGGLLMAPPHQERSLLMRGAGGSVGCLAIIFIVAVGCRRPQAGTAGQTPLQPARKEAAASAGTLPAGCAVAMTLDPVALGPAIDVVAGMMRAGTGTNGAAFGIDPKTDLRRMTGCRMPGRHGKRYVVSMVGRISAAVVENAVSDPRMGFRSETLAGIPVAGGASSWIARRGGTDAREGELVLASDLALLRETLVGPSGSYRLDLSAPFSAVVAGQELRNVLAAQPGVEETGLDRIRELTVTLTPGARAIAIRAFVGDVQVSQQLARSLKPLLAAVATRLVGPGLTPPDLTTEIDAGDLILRAELATGSWNAIAARLLPRSSSRR